MINQLLRMCILACLGGGLCLVGSARAGDWPQILGPQRDGQAIDERLADRWEQTPPVVWRHAVGQGYAGPAVADERVFVFHRRDDREILEAIEFESGRSVWRADFPAPYRGGIDPDSGPRCVPLVVAGKVVVFGAAGHAHCVDAARGTLRWSRDLYAELGGQDGYFGAGSTPIAVGDRLLFNVGGRPDAGLLALSLEDGKTLWQAENAAASYSSPVRFEQAGQTRVAFATRLELLIVDPQNGAVEFRMPFGQRGPTVNAATPLVRGDRMFLTASYGVGARLLSLESEPYRLVWSNDDTISSQYNTPIWLDSHLYGIHGREDVGRADLRCVEADSGSVVWTRSEFGVAHLLLADEKLLMLKPDGTLVLARPTPERYEELSRVSVSRHTTRALPALSRGRLFLRDNRSGGGELICFQLPTR